MSTRTSWLVLAIAFLLPATTTAAQREGYSYLSYVGSEVSLVSNAEDDSSARLNTPILAGDRIVTGSTSRAEAILADGSVLRIDVQTNLRFDRLARTYEAEDDGNSVYLERGAVSFEHRRSISRDEATRIDTDDATLVFRGDGVLRVETGRRGTEIYVVSGQAEVNARSGRATLRAGQYAFASGDTRLEIDWLDEPRDPFTRFVGDRHNLAGDGAGSRYVSADYGYDYAASGLDLYGSWVLADGSYAWRPSVAADWRPYADGYWRWTPSGLTWVSYEPWGWLPYHYGSWYWNAGLGWYWSPGATYSPAWVYWSYTPSWVGWCPIGYYGGYYGGNHDGHPGGGYYTSRRHKQGAERGTHAYPHLRGPVDVTRIDPRGWSYTSTARIGLRFDSRRDVLAHGRVGFRPGERGFVATTPLSIDRGGGGSATTAVQEAVRRVPRTLGAESRGGRSLEDLTPVLRRDGKLGATSQDSLRRAFVTPGQDPGYRPVSADQISSPRRAYPVGTTSGNLSREVNSGSASTRSRAGEGAAPGRGAALAPREGWRDPGVPTDTHPGRTAPRREIAAPLSGGFGRDREIRSDDGWRSPGGETGSGSAPSRTLDVPARRPDPAPASSEPPQRTGREATGLRGDEGWRGTDTPTRSSDAPRPAPAPRSAPPPSRSYDAPRPAPAPRSHEAPPSRSYDTPRSVPAPRSEAPPSRSYDTPRPAPAPHSYDAPSRSSSAPSSPSSAPPSSGSGGASPRSASPRG